MADMVFESGVIKYADNVDTDVIIPARYLNTIDKKELASHCMEDLDSTFSGKLKKGPYSLRTNLWISSSKGRLVSIADK